MGSVGVGLFFVLSGFILFYVYGPSLNQGSFSWRNFLTARFARLYPVYAFGLLLAFPGFLARVVEAVHAGSAGNELAAAVTAPLLLQAWHPAVSCTWNCPGWSLSAEAFFYLLFPVIGRFALQLAPGAAARVLFPLYIIGLTPPFWYLMSGLPAATSDEPSPYLWALWYTPLLRLPEFIFGVLLAQATLGGRWVLPRWCAWLMLAATALALYGIYYLPRAFTDTFLQNGFCTPLFGALIVAVAKSRPMVLGGRTLVRLGEASYATYIIHIPIWGMFRFADRAGYIDVERMDVYLAYLAVVLVGSLLIFRYIETPCRHFLRSALQRRRTRPTLSPVGAPSS